MIEPSSAYVQLSKCEEKAYKKYPRFVGDISRQVIDYFPGERNAFIAGYREAENDTIERAALWLYEHIKEFFDVNEFNCDYLEEFVRAMKENHE